jgi:ribonucleotide monophosphatase NagD (HAD superfamily)
MDMTDKTVIVTGEKRKKSYLIDMDGVLVHGERAIPGAK